MSKADQKVTALDPAISSVVVINTYTVAPERYDEALALLIRATEETLRHVPGFISANFHTNTDRRTIVNYAQWSSQESLLGARDIPEVAARIEEAAGVVTGFSRVQYALYRSVSAASA